MKAEELLKKILVNYLESGKDSNQDRADAVLEAMEEYGKIMYNQAIDDAIKNSNVIYTQKEFGMEISFAEVNKEPLLKLKK